MVERRVSVMEEGAQADAGRSADNASDMPLAHPAERPPQRVSAWGARDCAPRYLVGFGVLFK